jgi:hypothetical protein
VEAIEGVDVVVHCASDPHHPESDVVGTTNLIEALKECAPATHLIYISIVGVDALPWSYYRAKRDVELAIETAAPSWTIQRTTQFHSFLDTTLARLARSPLLVLPRGFAFQPVATQEVADLLVTHVHSGPTGRAPDFGGPDVLSATTLARGWLAARRKLRPIVTAPLPGRLSRAFRAGANLCPDGRRGHTTWQEYLATVDANAGAVAATAHFVQDRR